MPEVFKDFDIKAFFTRKNYRFENISTIFMPIQKHTDKVWILEEKEQFPVIADGIITPLKKIFIGVKVADCLPVLIYDPVREIIGAVHSGWRGTAAGILKKTLFAMEKRFNCKVSNIILAFGPSIKGCCYEVGEEVLEAVSHQTPSKEFIMRRNGKYHIDIAKANLLQALSLGVRYENIWISEDCTYCKNTEYASYRFHGKKAGRQYGVIGML